MDTLPTELVLEIISQISFDRSLLTNLHLVNRKLHNIVTHHDHPLVHQIASLHFPKTLALYQPPSREHATTNTLSPQKWLLTLHHRHEIVQRVQTFLYKYADPELEPPWKRVLKASLHHLHQLSSHRTPEGRLAYLASLPFLQLSLLYTTTILALTAARSIRHLQPKFYRVYLRRNNERDGRCFLECTLKYGPDFLLAVLMGLGKGRERAWKVMDEESEKMPPEDFLTVDWLEEWEQPTLLDSLMDELARKGECSGSAIAMKAWRVVQARDVFLQSSPVEELLGGKLIL